MKYIKLTKEYVAVVDEDDYEILKNYPWCVGGRKERPYALNRQLGLMHRHIWERSNGPVPKGFEVDHISRDRFDNRKINLRMVSRSQNNVNSGVRRDNTTGFKGVYLAKPKLPRPYQAYVNIGGKRISLGLFKTPEDAAYVRDQVALQLYGDHAWLNLL